METAIDTSQKTALAKTTAALNSSNTDKTTSDSTTETTGNSSEFSSYILKALNKTEEQNVSEEELFAGLIGQRVAAKDSAAGELFSTELAKLRSTMARSDGYVPVEDCANQALKNVVAAGSLTNEDAEKIKGEAFMAAQIDSNTDALYDDRGSANDPTIAVSKMEAALLSMRTILDQIDSGELECESRSLDSGATGSTSSTSSGVAATGSQQLDGGGGFLWKPVSESTGKLAVILPESFSGNVDRIEIHTALPATDENKLASVDYTKDYEDGRPLFRFDKSGAEYGDNVYVVAYNNDGSTANWEISDGSERND